MFWSNFPRSRNSSPLVIRMFFFGIWHCDDFDYTAAYCPGRTIVAYVYGECSMKDFFKFFCRDENKRFVKYSLKKITLQNTISLLVSTVEEVTVDDKCDVEPSLQRCGTVLQHHSVEANILLTNILNLQSVFWMHPHPFHLELRPQVYQISIFEPVQQRTHRRAAVKVQTHLRCKLFCL